MIQVFVQWFVGILQKSELFWDGSLTQDRFFNKKWNRWKRWLFKQSFHTSSGAWNFDLKVVEDLKQETNRFFVCRGCHLLGCWGVTFRDDPSRSTKLVAVAGRVKFGVKNHLDFFQVLKIVGSCTFVVIYMMLVFSRKEIHLTWQVTSRKIKLNPFDNGLQGAGFEIR